MGVVACTRDAHAILRHQWRCPRIDKKAPRSVGYSDAKNPRSAKRSFGITNPERRIRAFTLLAKGYYIYYIPM